MLARVEKYINIEETYELHGTMTKVVVKEEKLPSKNNQKVW